MGAAAEQFLSDGYLGTSIDKVAVRAGVARQTVYEHFGGKEQLFTEVMHQTIDEVGRAFFDRISGLEETSDLEASLMEIARALIAVAIEPRLLDLRRLVIGEVGRFPSLGRAYYDRGPGRTVEVLAEKFKELGDRTVLRLDDVEVAAQQFNWLVLSIPINRAMFDPEARFSDAEIRRYSREAVRTFLAAYG